VSRSNKMTLHHLIPRSRGGDSSKKNLKKVPGVIHDAWHTLFLNWLPEEIFSQILVMPEVLYNTSHKQLAWEKVFHYSYEDVRWLRSARLDVAGQILTGWVPVGYKISWEQVNQGVWDACCTHCLMSRCPLNHHRRQPFEGGSVLYYCYWPIPKDLLYFITLPRC